MKKRILSILLTLCMVLCIVPTGVFAEDCAEDLVDPVIRIIPHSDRGYLAQSGTLTAADFFEPGKVPANAKITAITAPASPSILDSISVDGDGTLSYEKKEDRGTKLKTDTYTVTITGDDCAPISAPLTVRQYLYADFKTTYNVGPWVYGDTRTWTWQVTNPGENGVWSAHMREEGIFEIYEETVDTTSEPGKSFYTIKYRAIKAGTTFIDILYVSDTTASWSPWCGSTVVAGGPVITRPLTVTAGSASITKGDALPTDLVTCSGLLDSEGRTDDRDTVLDNALSYRLLDANNEEVTAETARNTPGTYTVVPAAALKSSWDERYSLNRVNGTLTVEKRVGEQFTLTPGGRYYFDLSAMNIPGTVNSNLPDSTLHYVPFTYAGTVDAYSLKPASNGVTNSSKQASATTDEDAQYGYTYEHSLFVADDKITTDISWVDLNNAGFIFGKTYTAGSINYTLRAPTMGSIYKSSQRGDPANNEWDQILAKNSDFIKVLGDKYELTQFWGQDTIRSAGSYIYKTARNQENTFFETIESSYFGMCYRPVLELPTNLAADSLKIVELRTGEFMPGEDQNWINIIVKNGESFKAPAAEGLPRPDGISADTPMWWVDENLNFYKPGDTVPADVSALTAFYGGFGLFLDQGDGAVEVTPDNYTDIFGDGTASFVVPKGKSYGEIVESSRSKESDILEMLATGKFEENIFPNLKLKNADLTSVSLSEKYIGYESPLFITIDGNNTIGSLNGINRSLSVLSILGDGALTMNVTSRLSIYAQYGGNSVTVTGGLNIASALCIDSGSLTVTGNTQAVTLPSEGLVGRYLDDGIRLFLGSSANDTAEATLPHLSPEMQVLYERYLTGNSLTQDELEALDNALTKCLNDTLALFSDKTYVRFTNAWNVTYLPGADGTGDSVTDVKFYNDILSLRGKLFTRTGYTQVGWATIDGGEKIYGLDAVYTQNEALTLYPVWNTNKYTITFDTAGGSEIAPITQDYGSAITAPADPTRDGYTFISWDKEIPETMPAENITLTAQWKINQYTITFDTAGGSEIAPITQDYGSAITAPAAPTRDGYTFISWDKEIPETMPAENITITAQWKINQYTITFDTAGGSEIAPITQAYGSAITAPANPTRDGYTFISWDKEIPETMPAENITITAQWKDSEKPTGEIKISENSWKAFLNNITFGLFFKDTQTVTITAADNSGEVVTVEYLLSDKELTKAELDGMTFTAYTASFGIDPDNEYIIYVRLTDKASNTDYICSDGIVLDGTNPAITGIENGKTYCEVQTVTIDEKYVDTVTVNGTAVTLDENNSFVLAPADGEQKIIVTDKVGNTAEMTVTVNDGHTFGEWASNGDGTHTRKCTIDGCNGLETNNCSGGKATCTDKAVCKDCGEKYGKLDPANHEGGTEQWTTRTATAHEKKWSCCGAVIMANEAHKWANGVCRECGYGCSHTDDDKDHICNICRNAISNHEDTDKDHICDYCGKVLSECADNDRDHLCDYCEKKLSDHTGGKATCTEKAVCEVCGKAYGELDATNHADLKHIDAKAATKDAEGNIEYWYCEDCGKYYSDADATKEITKAATVTAKLPDGSKSPQTGDNSNLMLWIALLFISGGVLTGTAIISKKKKHNS